MSSTTRLGKLCDTIADQIRSLTTPGDATGAVKLNALAKSAEELPRAIIDCLGDGKIRRISYTRMEPSASAVEKPKIVESYSVEYKSKDSSFDNVLSIILGLLVAVLIVILVIRLSGSPNSPAINSTDVVPNRTMTSVTTKDDHDNNQFVLVFGDKLQHGIIFPVQCADKSPIRGDAGTSQASVTNAPVTP